MAENGNSTQSGSVQKKPPVVAVLGHVDHGKTTLLDTIRKAHVADKEFGAITQHIGAYQITNPQTITFIDTPGHEAFSNMRVRGVTVADIAILVVAADDSVKPQTVEAINHIKSAGIPMIVAINKVDLPTSDINRVKKDLATHEVYVEGYGGNTVVAEISAKTGKGIDELLEVIGLVADLEELTADPKASTMAAVIESRLDKGRGPVATVIVQQGTMRVGQEYYIADKKFKVRALINENAQMLKEADPATPCEVVGLSEVPQVGSVIQDNPQEIVNASAPSRSIFDTLVVNRKEELPFILKADVSGTLEAIIGELEKIEVAPDTPKMKLVSTATGDINESDISMAKATQALVLGFNVRITPQARTLAQVEGIPYKIYTLIYELTEDVDALLASGAIIQEKKVKGEAEVLALFPAENKIIAGVRISEGRLRLGESVVILRNGESLGSSKIKTMRKLKEDVKELSKGMEGGIVLEGQVELSIGDMLQYSP